MNYQLMSRRSFTGLISLLAACAAGSKAFGEEAQSDVYALLSSDGTLSFMAEKPSAGQEIAAKYRLDTQGGADVPWADIDVPWADIAEQVHEVQFLSPFSPTNMAAWFKGMRNLQSVIGIENLDTSACTNMHEIFCNCASLTKLDLSSFDTGACTDMGSMFYGCSTCPRSTRAPARTWAPCSMDAPRLPKSTCPRSTRAPARTWAICSVAARPVLVRHGRLHGHGLYVLWLHGTRKAGFNPFPHVCLSKYELHVRRIRPRLFNDRAHRYGCFPG